MILEERYKQYNNGNLLMFSEQVVSLLLTHGISFTDQLEENIASIEKHFQEVEFELKFEITNACNLNCSFCHQEFGSHQEKLSYFNFNSFRHIIDNLRNEKQIRWIRITGGEPMLHPECISFLEYAKNAGMATILNTNGTLLNRNNIKEYLSMVDIWKISMPSYGMAEMDIITQKQNTWTAKINALDLLKQEKATVDILVVLSHSNIAHLDDFVSINNKYPDFTMTFLRQESNITHRTPLTPQDVRAAVEYLSEHHRDIGLALPYCTLPDSELLDKIAGGRIECGPWSSLVVNEDGNVRHCYSRRKLYPKKATYKETAISLAAEDFANLPEYCLKCKYGARCLGGCRSPHAMIKSPNGQFMDYLADFNNISLTGDMKRQIKETL